MGCSVHQQYYTYMKNSKWVQYHRVAATPSATERRSFHGIRFNGYINTEHQVQTNELFYNVFTCNSDPE